MREEFQKWYGSRTATLVSRCAIPSYNTRILLSWAKATRPYCTYVLIYLAHYVLRVLWTLFDAIIRIRIPIIRFHIRGKVATSLHIRLFSLSYRSSRTELSSFSFIERNVYACSCVLYVEIVDMERRRIRVETGCFL